MVVDGTRRSISAKAGGNHAGARECSYNHADEAEARGSIGCPAAEVAAAVSAMQMAVTVGSRGGSGQHNLNSGGQVAGARGGDLGSSFGVELEMLAGCHRDALQAGLDFLFDSVGWGHVVKQDSQLPVPRQTPCRLYLHHRTSNDAALRQDQMIRGDQRFGDERFDGIPFL